MNLSTGRNRVLNPLERFSENVFGLIMMLSFTCAFSVAEAGREDVRTVSIGAIGCNLSWGIIDALKLGQPEPKAKRHVQPARVPHP